MADLIDRQALLRDIEKYHLSDGKFQHWVEVQPSAERHGKWLNGQGFAGNYFDCLVCDQCKKESMAKTNYCPNCGAIMDKPTD